MNKKGFVMIETIIVITILSIGLISLYTTYSIILSKASIKSNYDNTEYVYKTYYVKEYIVKNNLNNYAGNSYTYDISNADAGLKNIMELYNIEKIYLLNWTYNQLMDRNNLLNYDGSTINYFKSLGGYDELKKHIMVKFKEEIYSGIYNMNFASLDY